MILDRTLLSEEYVAQFKDDTGSRDKNVLKLSKGQKKRIKKNNNYINWNDPKWSVN